MSPARAAQMRSRCARDMRERAAQLAQPVRLAADMRMQRDRAHQRRRLRLLQHLVELIDDEIREMLRRHAAHHDGVGVVRLLRIGHREQRPGARRERDRPVVVTPVEHVVVAGLLQQVGRDVALGNPRAEPAARRLALMLRDFGCGFGDQLALLGFRQLPLPLRIGAPMRGDLAAGVAKRRDQLRAKLVNAAN